MSNTQENSTKNNTEKKQPDTALNTQQIGAVVTITDTLRCLLYTSDAADE